jgi:trk system potassium uptake protein TrkA
MENSKGSVMKALYRIASNKAETMEFIVNDTTRNLNIPLKHLSLKQGILVALIIHQNRIIIPEGNSSIQAGDTVIIVSRNHTILDINDIFADPHLEFGMGGGQG